MLGHRHYPHILHIVRAITVRAQASKEVALWRRDVKCSQLLVILGIRIAAFSVVASRRAHFIP